MKYQEVMMQKYGDSRNLSYLNGKPFLDSKTYSSGRSMFSAMPRTPEQIFLKRYQTTVLDRSSPALGPVLQSIVTSRLAT